MFMSASLHHGRTCALTSRLDTWISRLLCSECSWRRSGVLAGMAYAPWKSWKTPSASLRSPALESLTVYSITSWRECAGKQALHLSDSLIHTVFNCIWCNFLLMPVFQVMQTLCYKILYCTVALACSTESSAGVNFETSCVSTLQVHAQRKQHAFETMRSIGLLASSMERLSWWLTCSFCWRPPGFPLLLVWGDVFTVSFIEFWNV